MHGVKLLVHRVHISALKQNFPIESLCNFDGRNNYTLHN